MADSLEQTSYDAAYFVLPKYAHGPAAKLDELYRQWGVHLGAFLYVMARKIRNAEPSAEDAKRYRWHHDTLPGGRAYHAIEFPPPPPFDTARMMAALKSRSRDMPVLAPHLAAVLYALDSGSSYYVLSQNPGGGGGTTLRSVTIGTKGYENANLGPGPEPTLADFLGTIAGR